MSVADFLGMSNHLFSALGVMFSPINQNNYPILCELFGIFTQALCLKSSSLLILVMSCERVFAAYFPIRYRNNISISFMTKVGAVCVLLASISSVASTQVLGNVNGVCPDMDPTANYLFFTIQMSQSSIVFLVVPSVGAFFLNLLLLAKMRTRKRFVLLIVVY